MVLATKTMGRVKGGNCETNPNCLHTTAASRLTRPFSALRVYQLDDLLMASIFLMFVFFSGGQPRQAGGESAGVWTGDLEIRVADQSRLGNIQAFQSLRAR